MKKVRYERLTLDKIVGGGQAIGQAADGRKLFVWGGLPGEDVTVRITKKKSKLLEGIVTDVHTASTDRITPADPDSYLSTSPWQIMQFDAEQHYKAQLIDEAFALHDVALPDETVVYSDNVTQHYRNKVEFSWYSDVIDDVESLDLAFFRRGSKGKIVVDQCSLLPESMMMLARRVRDDLHTAGITARQLKTLLIRCDQSGNCVWQLYVKDSDFALDESTYSTWPAQGGEIIYSDPRSPASRITERLVSTGEIVLTDTILDVPFRYATEGFFQVNIPVYEQALRDMQQWVIHPRPASTVAQPLASEGSAFPAERGQDIVAGDPRAPELVNGRETERLTTVDMYSGVGTIGLTIGGDDCTLVEINEHAVREMKRNIARLGSSAQAILAPAEHATDYITSDKLIIVDPPRAGLHADVITRLLDQHPPRIIYLSCNPVTQARDVALLLEKYRIVHHAGYNFFPRTPHIEHLVVLDAK